MWNAPDRFFETLLTLAVIGAITVALLVIGSVGFGIWFLISHVQVV